MRRTFEVSLRERMTQRKEQRNKNLRRFRNEPEIIYEEMGQPIEPVWEIDPAYFIEMDDEWNKKLLQFFEFLDRPKTVSYDPTQEPSEEDDI